MTGPDEMPLVRTDLNWPDNEGRPQALIPVTEFDPARIHPGATAKVGTEDEFYRLRILATELNTAPDGSQTKVHVTFEEPEEWRRDDEVPLETAPVAAERDGKLAVVRGVPCDFGPDGPRYYPEAVAVRLDALLEEMLASPGDLTIRHWGPR